MLKNKHLAAAAAVSLALAGTALTAGAGSASNEAARCEIVTANSGGMVTLEGVVHAESAMSGSYSFRVETVAGGGSSNIRQGGGFSAGPAAPATLGRVMLGGSGAVYEATLEVDTPQGPLTCTERAGRL